MDVLTEWLLILQMVAAIAHATSVLPPPPELSRQLAASSAGEYAVRSATTVILEDGFPVTYASVEAITAVSGKVEVATVIFPGGLVDGKFVDWSDDGVAVRAGETLFLMLEAISDRPGFYVVAYGFETGFFRMVDSPRGPLMASVAGHIVVDTPCDSSMFRAVHQHQREGSPDVDESGRVDVPLLHNLIALDDPESIGLLWYEAIAALVECGGEQ